MWAIRGSGHRIGIEILEKDTLRLADLRPWDCARVPDVDHHPDSHLLRQTRLQPSGQLVLSTLVGTIGQLDPGDQLEPPEYEPPQWPEAVAAFKAGNFRRGAELDAEMGCWLWAHDR